MVPYTEHASKKIRSSKRLELYIFSGSVLVLAERIVRGFFIFEPPDCFTDFVAGFFVFLVFFMGKKCPEQKKIQENPRQNPPK